jgi:hypothetical protein
MRHRREDLLAEGGHAQYNRALFLLRDALARWSTASWSSAPRSTGSLAAG